MTYSILRTSLLCILLAATSTAADKPKPDDIMIYKTIGDVKLEAHVFYPGGKKPDTPVPAVAFFFGGGWTGGSPGQFYGQSKALNEVGVVAVCFDYRVSSRQKTTPFECVQDGKSAIRWLRQQAEKLGIDPQRVVAAGGSAGGHVAACTGVINGHEGPGEDLTISSVPQLMILFNPVLDTTSKGYGAGKVVGRETEISPCHHVKAGQPPTLLFHGTADTTVPFENATRFRDLMTAAGNSCELVPFEGANHGFFNGSAFRAKASDDAFDQTMVAARRFLQQQFKLPPPAAR